METCVSVEESTHASSTNGEGRSVRREALGGASVALNQSRSGMCDRELCRVGEGEVQAVNAGQAYFLGYGLGQT